MSGSAPVTQTTSRLEAAPASLAGEVRALARDARSHDAFVDTLPAMNSIETGGQSATSPLCFPFAVAAWNLERCLFPQESAAKLAATGADVVLLSEMDDGMARSGQRHPTADIAGALGMAWLYGVEFLELGLGSETEREFCVDDFNMRGFHGNAALSRVGFERPFLLRLPGRRHWFLNGEDQPRLGERMAIGGLVETGAGPVVMVSTHLESVADAAQREAQLAAILDLIDARFPGLPALIGGDLNTGNHIGGDWRHETLFAMAASRGYQTHGGPADRMTTRPSLITRWPDRVMKLDWFLTRGLVVGPVDIIASTEDSGRPLSDHDMITIRITGFAPL